MHPRPVVFAACTILALLLGAGTAGAWPAAPAAPADPQSPLGPSFTYQGQLQRGGAPVTATCDMAFRLYGVASGGSAVASPITTTVPVTGGLFTVALNFGTAAFDGNARWLDITVRCPAGSGSFAPLDPRQPLTAAPYALYALNAWALTGNASATPANFLGTTNNVSLTLAINNTAVMHYAPGAIVPDIYGGYSANSVAAGVSGAVIAGGGQFAAPNTVSANFGTVSGGSGNAAGGTNATVGGGGGNQASGDLATVGGGASNVAGFGYATVGGGNTNHATLQSTTIAGGEINTASNYAATVGGGGVNTASGVYATVGGGYGNQATGDGATIGGGGYVIDYGGNRASGKGATVSGGLSNTASSFYATVGGGVGNIASGQKGTVGGGQDNTASNLFTTVAGGTFNSATDDSATVGGGGGNTATNIGATVGGGGSNNASTQYSTVSGGFTNGATGDNATVGGGAENMAGGLYATVPGGVHNTATGAASFAAGDLASAIHNGAFVWADSTGAVLSSTATNQFLVRASGGVILYTNSSASVGASLAAGSSSWSMVSDRNLKANFAPVDGVQVLEALSGVPIQTWNYQSQAEGIRHMGPMAQDFQPAFHIGENDTTISTVDAQGVALAAIQGLHSLVKDQKAQLEQLRSDNGAQQVQIADLQGRLAALEGAGPGVGNSPGIYQLLFLGLLLLNLGGVIGFWLARRTRKAGVA